MRAIRRVTLTSGLILAAMAGIFPASAQSDSSAWKTVSEFPGLDTSGLSPVQKHVWLDLVRGGSCNCGCTMKIAECRIKDPRCARSRSLALLALRQLQEGKSADDVRAELERRMHEGPPVLAEEAVPINIAGAPAKGAANPKITIVEFSDFQ